MDETRRSAGVAEEVTALLSGDAWPERVWSDHAVFRETLARTAGLVVAHAWQRFGASVPASDAEEIAARVLEDLHFYRDRFRGEARVAALLRSFVENRVLKRLRDEGREAARCASERPAVARGADPVRAAEEAEFMRLLRDAVGALSPACRELLRAYYLPPGAADPEEPGRSEARAGTTYQRRWRCRERLRAELAKRGIHVPSGRKDDHDRP